MKKKSSKKRSNKERPEKEIRYVTEDVPKNSTPFRSDLQVDWKAFVAYFNRVLKQKKSSISAIKVVSTGMKSRIQGIVYEYQTKTVVQTAIEKMAESDFLNGRIPGARTNKTFLASFAWLFHSDEIFENVLGGFYDNPPELEPTAEELRRQEAEEREAERERRRQEARRIEEERHEQLQQQIREREENQATPEQLEKIWAQIKLPPLKENEK